MKWTMFAKASRKYWIGDSKSKNREGNIYALGNKHSEEARAKVSAANSKRVWSKESKERSSKCRRDPTEFTFSREDGEVFKGMRYDFVKRYGLTRSCVDNLVHGRQSTHKGWIIKN